jgi:hypothetical protein
MAQLPRELEKSYRNALKWTGADFTHEYVNDGTKKWKGDEPEYCSGEQPGCLTCKQCEKDAKLAANYAKKAMQEAKRGQWENAISLAEEAVDIETEWGDAPSYRPFLTAMEEAAEDAGAEASVTKAALGHTR